MSGILPHIQGEAVPRLPPGLHLHRVGFFALPAVATVIEVELPMSNTFNDTVYVDLEEPVYTIQSITYSASGWSEYAVYECVFCRPDLVECSEQYSTYSDQAWGLSFRLESNGQSANALAYFGSGTFEIVDSEMGCYGDCNSLLYLTLGYHRTCWIVWMSE